MFEPIDIYVRFRRAQANASNRGFRIPKDFNNHLNFKMSNANREALILATGYFNTKWSNIDPLIYFECGFELLKTFSYTHFFDERVLNLYISRDKNRKREMEVNKESIKNSLIFIKTYMVDSNIKGLKEYCRLRNGYSSLPIDHYIQNSIDKYVLTLLINKGFLILTEDDKARIPYIMEQYRECLYKLKELKEDIVL